MCVHVHFADLLVKNRCHRKMSTDCSLLALKNWVKMEVIVSIRMWLLLLLSIAFKFLLRSAQCHGHKSELNVKQCCFNRIVSQHCKYGTYLNIDNLPNQLTSLLPHLDYCDIAYMCTTVQNLNKLQLIQNGARRTILQVPKDTNITQMHRELAIPTLEQRCQLHLATECYESATTPESGLKYIFNEIGINRRSTRLAANMGMVVPRLNTTQGRKACRYRGPNCWNGLDQDLKTCESLAVFKSNMLRKLMSNVNHPG